MNKLLILFSLICFSLTVSVKAQDDVEKIRILFIFDGSNSMNAQWQKSSKINVARKLMLQTLDSLEKIENIELALRMYGHQTRIMPGQQDCSDTKLEVPFASSKTNSLKIQDKLRSLDCKGTTPIALSLEQAGNMDFPECDNCRNVIILITDGIEACDGDPCAVSRALNKQGIKLKPFIIGVGLDTSYLGQFKCIGEFLSADTEDSFKSVLSYVVSQAVNNTTIQVNLKDGKDRPRETDVTMSFYIQNNKTLEATYMHTMNLNRVPDTIALNPLHKYKLVVHTTPEIVVNDIAIKPGTHNIIEVDAAQGFLDLRIQSNPDPTNGIQCIVRKSGEMQTLNVQQMNSNHKYLVGKYDLEILTLPRTYMTDVNIKAGLNTKIVIPKSGYITIKKRNGPCQILELKDGEERWICNIPDNFQASTVKVLPGKYKVTYRSDNSISTANTIERVFTITPNHEELIYF
jgi:Ca-activated chloride channel family protein